MDDLSWPLGWDSHGECINTYGYILDKTYDELWHKTIKLSWFIKLLYYMDS